jgi:UDP-N-acetyl-D-glucosamine dehydrogenase
VAWHDPLVGTWRGENSADLTGFDITVVVTKHDVVKSSDISKSSYVFDCTGTITGADGI